MSKGKQWWPLRATVNDAKEAITEFQQRLRDRQWIRDKEGAVLFHVYSFEGPWSAEHLSSVNEYMQISASDTAVKNQGRVAVLRLLCMLLKWHGALRPHQALMSPPVVFSVPNLSNGGFQYGLIATIEADARRQGAKPTTIIISEHDISTEHKMSGRHWVMPQSGTSYRWLTTKTWNDQRQKPSFGKWVYGSYTERKTWLEQGDDDKGVFAQTVPYTNQEEQSHQVGLLKQLGAMWQSQNKQWLLPEFWDKEAVEEWIKNAPRPKANVKPAYKKIVQHATSNEQPEWVDKNKHDPSLANIGIDQLSDQSGDDLT